MAKEIIVTQVRSAINKPKDQKATLIALGCKKLNVPIHKTASPQVLGMINKVKHLVKVEDK
ncbi:50S ribosomal protein L30 [Cryomorpha ignava]|uniref:Large ribosomal subunit protein uL30 n=1 Tax=Cryomorpha ignava TaxID=101383 RepID=A0A7K3WPJ5_9FLAO|nr:50S ribosomal protein L30 [Cryomorpha ignava]NEN23466.1 50S ribosomal protein L30 [Cryomorpha ignava]